VLGLKKGDFLWGFLLLIWVAVLVIPGSRDVFMEFTSKYSYFGGFIKFAILATMGDLLGARILKGNWIIPKGIIFRVIIWGIIGLMVNLVFTVFMGGAAAAQASGKLPFKGVQFAQAFFGSTIMNVSFGPMMMAFHKFTDLFIDVKYEKKGAKVTMTELVDRLDWHSLIQFSWIKTCPLFWIPAHTIVFLLPEQYRVITSAFLSIALGLLMAISKKGKTPAKA
jgi:hypothetical protein